MTTLGGGGRSGPQRVEAFIQPPLPAARPSAGFARLQSPVVVAMSVVGDAPTGPAVKPGAGGKKPKPTGAAGAAAGAKGGAATATATKPRPPQHQQASGGRKGGGGGGGNNNNKGGGRGLSNYARKPQHPPRKYHERKSLIVEVYQEAQGEMRAGRLDKAEELFRRCLTMDRKDARSWLQLAQLANRRGRQEEARSYFAQVGGCVCAAVIGRWMDGWTAV